MEINHSILNSFLISIVDLIKLIENCEYNLKGEEWINVSKEVKHLINVWKILTITVLGLTTVYQELTGIVFMCNLTIRHVHLHVVNDK